MKRSPVILLVCVLVLGPATLLFPAGAVAIPDNQNPSGLATPSHLAPRTGNPALTQELESGPDGVRARQDQLSPPSHTCRHDAASAAPLDTITSGNSCADASDTQQRFSVQLGRRIGNRADILGELDGVRMDYRLGEGLSLNGIAGYSVLAAEDVFNPARQVFGISAATDQVARTWDMNSYLIEQQENGQVTGRTMGGAVRYLQPRRSMLVYLDYDIADNSLGTLMTSGAWKLPFKTTISATLDHHNHTIPGRQQKYLQQSMTAMDGWDWLLPTDRVAYYTGNGSGDVSVLAVGLSHALSKRIKLTGDVVVLDATNGLDADAITTTAAQSSEYFYHLKLTGKDLMMPGDRNKLDLRHSVTDAGRTSTATLDTRYVINRFWNLISRLRADYHSPEPEKRSRWVAAPSLKMEYRLKKQFGFQIEAGGELSNGESAASADSRSSYFVSLGYQAKF